MEFCTNLLSQEKKELPDGMTRYTLPTETQWEYFRGDAAWEDAVIKRAKPEEVGSSGKANKYGLYDVLGNVWELCVGDINHRERVARGGGWDNKRNSEGVPGILFAASRGELVTDDRTGFRVVLVPGSK